MSRQIINVGSSPNDGAGDPIRTAFIKTNDNFIQLFALPNPTPPVTLVGKAGDVPGMYAYNSTYFYYCFGTYDGSTVIWAQVAQIGSISVANIVNGTSNVKISSANANVTISVNGTSNVAVFSSTDVSVTGNINVPLGNIHAFAYYTYNNISAAGNIRGGNIRTSGQVTATGNVYGDVVVSNYLYGDGSNISNISGGGSYSNTNVAAYLQVLTSNVSTTGNITGSYILGNGRNLTGLPLTYGNANVANFLPIFTGNISSDYMTATGNLRGGNIKTVGIISATGNITTDGYFVGTFVGNVSGNLVVPGSNTQVLYNNNGNAGASTGMIFNSSSNVLSVTGNVYGNYFLGNGSQLTGLPVTYGNANVAAYLPTYTGNITAAEVSATGNITGSYILGNGSQLTGIAITGTNANALTGNTLSSNVTNSSLTAVGTLSNLSVTGNVVASGVVTSTGTFRLPSYTTLQIANISAVEGDMVYNSTVQKVQAYQANATGNVTWVSLSISTYQ